MRVRRCRFNFGKKFFKKGGGSNFKVPAIVQISHLDCWIAGVLSKKGAYMFMLILRKPDMVVFVGCIGDCFTLSLFIVVESCLNTTNTSLPAFNLG
jgi:hypothetical protein